jgi:hypothetical protein
LTLENPESPIDPKPPSQGADAEPKDHQDKPEPPVAPKVLAPNPPSPSAKHCEVTANMKRDRIDWWTLRMEGIGLAVLVIYTIATIAIWCANKKAAEATVIAANAAKTASETAQKQLEQSERPWLKVSFSIATPGITFTNGGMQLNVVPHIENVGNSVATGVVSPMKVFLADDGDAIFKEPLKRQKELCDQLATQSVTHSNGVVIFPNDSDDSWGYGLGLSKGEVDAAKKLAGVKGSPPTGPKLLIPIVYGCVDYTFDTSERHHQTQFIFELQQTNRTSTVPRRIPVIAIRANEPVSQPNVVFTKYPFGGFYAY